MIKKGGIKGCLAGKILRIVVYPIRRYWTEETKSYVRKTLGGRGILIP